MVVDETGVEKLGCYQSKNGAFNSHIVHIGASLHHHYTNNNAAT